MNSKLDLSLISKYRGELMGYGILGVMLWHTYKYSGIDAPWFFYVAKLIFTTGFFFLSGFGLYYSFSKDSSLLRFYKKRVFRLIIPYIIIASPFFFLLIVAEGRNPYDYFLMISTLSFWMEGNFYAMWYIAMSLVVYLAYPLFHKVMFSNKGELRLISSLCLILVFWGILVGCQRVPVLNEQYDWMRRTCLFPIGIVAGYYAKRCTEVNLTSVVAISLVSLAVAVLRKNEFVLCVFGIIGLTILFVCLDKNSCGRRILCVLRGGGTYSLELYLLHVLLKFVLLDYTGLTTYQTFLIGVPVSILICVPIHKGIDRILQKL